MSVQSARLVLDCFLGFIAFFSVRLAVLNLLPIPVLDGGQAVFLIAEALRRKPLSLELRQRLTQIGLVVILGLMLLGIANDLLRVLPRSGRARELRGGPREAGAACERHIRGVI